jgi:putative ABC transport system permease protein
MLQNYLTTFVRIFLRQKLYSVINVAGLAIGIAAFVLIGLYVLDELSYDKFHRDSDRIYRVALDGSFPGGGKFNSVRCPYPLAEALLNESPAVEATVRVKHQLGGVEPVRYGERELTTKKFLYVDSSFFTFFDFKLLQGDKNDLLKGPGKVVLSKSMVKKLFELNDADLAKAIGRLIEVDDPYRTVMVTGIVEDPPANSHFHFDVLCSSETWEGFKEESPLGQHQRRFYLL